MCKASNQHPDSVHDGITAPDFTKNFIRVTLSAVVLGSGCASFAALADAEPSRKPTYLKSEELGTCPYSSPNRGRSYLDSARWAKDAVVGGAQSVWEKVPADTLPYTLGMVVGAVGHIATKAGTQSAIGHAVSHPIVAATGAVLSAGGYYLATRTEPGVVMTEHVANAVADVMSPLSEQIPDSAKNGARMGVSIAATADLLVDIYTLGRAAKQYSAGTGELDKASVAAANAARTSAARTAALRGASEGSALARLKAVVVKDPDAANMAMNEAKRLARQVNELKVVSFDAANSMSGSAVRNIEAANRLAVEATQRLAGDPALRYDVVIDLTGALLKQGADNANQVLVNVNERSAAAKDAVLTAKKAIHAALTSIAANAPTLYLFAQEAGDAVLVPIVNTVTILTSTAWEQVSALLWSEDTNAVLSTDEPGPDEMRKVSVVAEPNTGAASRAVVGAAGGDGTDSVEAVWDPTRASPESENLIAQIVGVTDEKRALVSQSMGAPDADDPDASDQTADESKQGNHMVMDQAEDEKEEASDPETDDRQSEALQQVEVPIATVLEAPPTTLKAAIRPAAGSYNSNAWAANTMFQMSLSDRLGNYYPNEASPHQGSGWIRYRGSSSRLKDDSGELLTKGDKNSVMMGVDMLVQSANGRDQYTIGVTGGYGHYTGRTRSDGFNYSSVGKVDGYGVGLYATYQQDVKAQQGLYSDGWLLWNRFNNTVKGGELPKEKYDSKGVTASLELGYHIPLAERDNVKYVLRPHTQVIYQNVRAASFREVDGTRVGFLNSSRLQTAVGARASAHISTGLVSVITPHIEANWLHSTKGHGVRLDDTESTMNSGRNTGQLKLGVEGELNRKVSLNIELFHNRGNGGYRETGGNLMATYRY